MEFQGYRVIQSEGEFEGLKVFRATATDGDRHVQIRLFPNSLSRFPLLLEQFRANFNTLSHLQHPGICPVISLNAKSGNCYIVLPSVVAGNLEDRFRSGFYAGLDVLQVIDEISSALEYAHQNGIIHGNLIADNILIDDEGHIHIVGFGEAVILKALPSARGHGSQATKQIEPPEAPIASKLSPATDQYSLALIALRLLTGLPVDEAVEALTSDMVKIQKRISREGRYSLDLSGQVVQVISRALSEKPSKRYPSVKEFNRALQIAFGVIEEPRRHLVQAAFPSPIEVSTKEKKRSFSIAPILTGIAVLGVVATIALTQWVDFGGSGAPTEMPAVGTQGLIELPDQSDNSGLVKEQVAVPTVFPEANGILPTGTPTPTTESPEGNPQSTSPPQPTRPPSQPTATMDPLGTETPTPDLTATPDGSETPTQVITPTPTGFEPTDTPQPTSTPTVSSPTNPPPPPTIDPKKCNYTNSNSPHFCTPTP